MFKLIFYVPKDDLGKVRDAVFKAGAGKIGENYEQCCFESEGVGQFLPVNNADPTIGELGVVERVVEIKVEMICNPLKIQSAVEALKRSHPYEEVAYEVYKLESF